MHRRSFLTLLATSAAASAAWPLAARAQQAAMPVVGFLNGASAWEYAGRTEAFRKGLSESGFVEGRNVWVEYRWAEGHYERLPLMAADLVRRQVAVIATGSTPAALAAKAATTAIPIVFNTAVDPVQFELVASLNRPGRNLTGVTTLGVEVAPKRLELLHELVPTATSFAFLINPANPNVDSISKGMRWAADALRMQLHVLHAKAERDFDSVFAHISQSRAAGLVIGNDVFFNSRVEQLATLALRNAVPTAFQFREFAAAGGLMSYGSNNTDTYRLAGIYTGRILKGEKPADLPVQQATRIELIINMKTARALGLTMPTALLVRADEVIE